MVSKVLDVTDSPAGRLHASILVPVSPLGEPQVATMTLAVPSVRIPHLHALLSQPVVHCAGVDAESGTDHGE